MQMKIELWEVVNNTIGHSSMCELLSINFVCLRPKCGVLAHYRQVSQAMNEVKGEKCSKCFQGRKRYWKRCLFKSKIKHVFDYAKNL